MAEVSQSEIEALSIKALTAHGAAGWVAIEVARAVARSEAEGNRICGLYYLESYCLALQSGRVNGSAEPVVSRPRPGFVAVDGQMGFAQPTFARALPLALVAARECGTASLAVGHTHTCTSLGYFTRQIAEAGMIALGTTNAAACVAPPGGRTRVIGTNPVAFAVPDGKGGIAMMFDQSTTVSAMGHITMARTAGKSIPEGWAIDAKGLPTTDPQAAIGGSLMSLGGPKGWGFGLMAEILAAGMTGSVLSRDVSALKSPDGPPHDLGQFYMLIDPGVASGFGDVMAGLAEQVAKDEGARMPGQGKVLADPVEVPDDLWALVCALG